MRFKNTSDHIGLYQAILDQIWYRGIVSQLARYLSRLYKSNQLCHQDPFTESGVTWLRASVTGGGYIRIGRMSFQSSCGHSPRFAVLS